MCNLKSGLSTKPASPPEWKPSEQYWEEIKRLQREAAMQCDPDRYSLAHLGALNAWPYGYPQRNDYPKNAIGIPLIRAALGEKE